ncbi:hypothetical protein [Azospirillum sp. TSO22-1]|uniref:hypothetical protein n=1 Tax=Azospirillum sp. TSO22-1 TaxID=716789 RepID=UPI000D6202E8|nr:hypothetical protein [Azospirillum sp. TSO22-1]PWC34902.1 hypothetical protein TSO221_30805 [Azospirillum sp. TSO22-1]
MASSDLTTAVMATRGFALSDRDAYASVVRSVGNSLTKLRKRNAIVKDEDDTGFPVWRLARHT